MSVLFLVLLTVAPIQETASRPAPAVGFIDATAAMNLEFLASCGTPAKRDIVEANGAGAAVADFDRDGDLDIFFAKGATLESINSGEGVAPELRVRDGGGFLNPGATSGLSILKGWWTGVAAGDADGDGDVDLYLCGYLKSVYLENDTKTGGPIHFIDKTRQSGLSDGGWATAACWFDADNDGDLDLYLVRYLELDPRNPPRGTVGSLHLPCTWRGMPVYCGPRGFVATPDRFFKNKGDGTFVESTSDSGFDAAPASYGLGICPVDYDLDGDVDLYISNDSKANFLWRNDGGKFIECAFEAGAGLGDDGSTYAGMGVAADDATGDGFPEIVVTNFSDEPVSLYKNRRRDAAGNVLFDTISTGSGLAARTMATLKWGVDFADFDLDGDLDLFVANGHVYPQADSPNTGTTYRQQNQVFLNDGNGKYELLKPAAGSPLLERRAHRTLMLLDVNDDAASDLLIIPVDGPAVLLQNNIAAPAAGGPSRMRIELQGKGRNSEALGAIVTIRAGGREMTRQYRRGGSYGGSRDPRLCFAVPGGSLDEIRVRWPGGEVETIAGAGLVNHLLVIRQGAGIIQKQPVEPKTR